VTDTAIATTAQPVADELEAPDTEPEEARPGPRRWRTGRIVSYLVTVFFVITLNFFLPRAMPGDPVQALVASDTSNSTPSRVRDDETRRELARYYGLDRPLAVQYVRYLGDLARGDLGVSVRYNAPVSEVVGERLPWSLLLGGSAVVLAAIVGLIPGVHSGWRRGKPIDRGLLALFLGVRNIPPFFLASMAVFVFAVQLRWVPVSGATTAFADFGFLGQVVDVAHHLVLPASVLAVQISALNYLVMRAGMVSELGADYLLLGRAKGLSERRLKYHYAARNAMLPVVTMSAMQLAFALTIAPVFIETVFAYPGIGRLVFEAVALRDYPLLQGCFLVLSILVVTLNLVADLLHARVDPRTTE